ncbi:unnamed protein product [Cylicocyclus nassatus]|uniref:Pyridoxine-5'-phosphate oxidase n=1 Tax=Cylicocyclus nassatus TaxID=53992 RepID=A0AA36M5E8_CYLNA|nr:unnamed protein product [Cylicocyclus nassatus]
MSYYRVLKMCYIQQRLTPLRAFSTCIRLAMADAPVDISGWRKKYLNEEEPEVLEENLPTNDPHKLFDIWFKKIAEQKDTTFEELNCCAFSTVGKNNRPSSRIVLLKSYKPPGFSFFTNYDSRKGKELEANPYACMLFYWARQVRQVRIEGKVEKLPEQDAIDYWNSRPLSSRIGSKSSEQSSVIPNRQFLKDKRKALQELAEREGEKAITKPDTWGGYILIPDYYEFWQGQSDRVHDRLEFRKTDVGNGWEMRRLSP